MKQSQKSLVMGALLFILLLLGYSIVTTSNNAVTDVTFSDFLIQVQEGKLKDVEVEIRNNTDYSWTAEGTRYRSSGVLTDDILKQLQDQGVRFKITIDNNTGIWQTLFTWLPLMLIVVVALFIVRNMQSGSGKAMSFGKSRAKLNSEGGPKVTFKDVAGVDEAKEELREIVEFLKDPKKFTRLGGKIPKGVLLMGPPGTGKTLLARGVAGEAGVPFFSISGSDFVEMFVGVGASRVRDLFEQSKKHAPCIVFIDEIDAVGRHRGAGLGGGHDEREQTLNQLLVEMDGFESNDGVILVAATNRPDVLDPALLRPGRFDRRVVVPKPDLAGRATILKVHTRKVPLDEKVNLELLARGTPGFSGADIANLVNEAALIAAKANKNRVGGDDLELAKDKVMMGAERKSMVLSKAEIKNTAYHEAGHTLVAELVEHADPVHKVTIIPRGRALGLTQMLPEEDRLNVTKRYAIDQIAVLFGGRIAEDIMFDEITTGAGNDLDRATDMARKMVCEWGMSSLGAMTFGQKEGNIFLGRDINRSQEYSEETAVAIDKEVKDIMDAQYERATKLIEENKDALIRIAEALIEYETLDADDVQLLMRGEEMTREPPKVRMQTREDLEEKRRQKEKRDESGPKDLLGPLADAGA